MSVFQAAMPTGSYPSLMAGGVQCTQLHDNADLNDCVPENDMVFQAWVCAKNSTSNTMSNTPFANFGRTFYLTAVKTWRNPQDNNSFNVVQTLYSVAAKGDRLIWTRAIDGAGTGGWSDWKELIVADGSYPALGAGYLAKRQYLSAGTTNLGWYKIGSVSFSELSSTDNFSVILLVNGIYATQGQSGAAESGFIEFEGRRNAGGLQICAVNILAGSLKTGDLSCVIGDNSCDLYLNMPSEYNSFEFTVINEKRSSADSGFFTFDMEFYGASAPANAIYAVVRNIASYAESIPAASQTVLGGAKMYVDSDGYFCIDTQ